MLLVLLLACHSEDLDSVDGLGDCPAETGVPEVRELDGEHIGAPGESNLEGQIEVFHDSESAFAWWTDWTIHPEDHPLPEIDFTTTQAVGYISWVADEYFWGEYIDGFGWTSPAMDTLVAQFRHECGDYNNEAVGLYINIWVTPIAPVERCDFNDCESD